MRQVKPKLGLGNLSLIKDIMIEVLLMKPYSVFPVWKMSNAFVNFFQ